MKIATLRLLLSAILLFAGTLQVDANDNLEKLRQIQKQVQSVASQNMEATVAITDGVGFGSGVIISPDGLILTAGHVMGDARSGAEFEIIFPSGKSARARALGKNMNVDAGMIQLIDSGPWPYVELSDSDAKLGQWVVCMGHSGGYELGRKPPVRTGRLLENRNELMVTDAVLIGGDSGGPLFDLNGKLVGIHSSIGDTVAENRHVAISTFKQYWGRMKAGESWGRLPELSSMDRKRREDPKSNQPPATKPAPKLGVVVDRALDLAKITDVRDNSPAKRVGIKEGDVVKSLDGVPVTGPQHLIDLVKSKTVGDSVTLIVIRGGQELRYQIILDTLN